MKQKSLKDAEAMTQPKLTPKQEKTFYRWMQERRERQKILDEFFAIGIYYRLRNLYLIQLHLSPPVLIDRHPHF